MRKFCQGNTLVALIVDNALPAFLDPVAARIRTFLASNYEGTLSTENDAHGVEGWIISPPKDSSREEVGLLEKVVLLGEGITRPYRLAKVVRNGVETFQAMDESLENSAVQYRSPLSREVSCGRIIQIIGDARGTLDGTRVLVRSFEPLDAHQAALDPYRRYPELQAKLYCSTLASRIEVVKLGGSISSFAETQGLITEFR